MDKRLEFNILASRFQVADCHVLAFPVTVIRVASQTSVFLETVVDKTYLHTKQSPRRCAPSGGDNDWWNHDCVTTGD